MTGRGAYARALAAALALLFSQALPVVVHGDTTSGAAVREVQFTQLPPEARDTIALIRKGGPFHHERDGVPFGNFEKRLPVQARGYYREYTVRTPGVKHRGARRIVAGRGGELYYTEDHYQTFRRIREP